MARFKISGVPIVDEQRRLVGIITNRDLQFEHDETRPIARGDDHARGWSPRRWARRSRRRSGSSAATRSRSCRWWRPTARSRGSSPSRTSSSGGSSPNSNKDQHGRLRVAAALGATQGRPHPGAGAARRRVRRPGAGLRARPQRGRAGGHRGAARGAPRRADRRRQRRHGGGREGAGRARRGRREGRRRPGLHLHHARRHRHRRAAGHGHRRRRGGRGRRARSSPTAA